jgi:hypothetical protein
MTHAELLPREIQVLGSIILVAFLAWLASLIRAQRVSLRDSLIWLLSTCAALVVTIFPQLLARTATLLQIQVPSNALFGAAIVYLAFNLLSNTIASSVNAAQVRRLTQECALLRGELESIRRERTVRPPAGSDEASSGTADGSA